MWKVLWFLWIEMKWFRNQRKDFLLISSFRYVFGRTVDGVAFVLFGIQHAGQKKALPSSLQRVAVRKQLITWSRRPYMSDLHLDLFVLCNVRNVNFSKVALCMYWPLTLALDYWGKWRCHTVERTHHADVCRHPAPGGLFPIRHSDGADGDRWEAFPPRINWWLQLCSISIRR